MSDLSRRAVMTGASAVVAAVALPTMIIDPAWQTFVDASKFYQCPTFVYSAGPWSAIRFVNGNAQKLGGWEHDPS
jgi:hypothetical protein